MHSARQLVDWVCDARARSIALIADLDEEQLTVPLLPTVNPLLWELCHAAYFQEFWVLREGVGLEACRGDVDALFDSMTIAHETRWRLPVPSREAALDYVVTVRDRVCELLSGEVDDRVRYLVRYSVHHEDMHAEALTYTRQALGLPAPSFCGQANRTGEAVDSGDVSVEGGDFRVGAERDVEFCFDNEKWAHDVRVEPFAIARCAVREGDFAAFTEAGGYQRRELWSATGWRALLAGDVSLPCYWRRRAGQFERREFDGWRPIDPSLAMMHVSFHEAEAYCRWANRRLPTEVEWELAARVFGDSSNRNLDWRTSGAVAAASGPDTSGCRHLFGNVWEWTASRFEPYAGFEPDMYVDYSQTSFETRKVLRGGCWATPSRFVRPTLRNFFQPTRRDVFAGFRTCAIDG